MKNGEKSMEEKKKKVGEEDVYSISGRKKGFYVIRNFTGEKNDNVKDNETRVKVKGWEYFDLYPLPEERRGPVESLLKLFS
ncbi:hypothetical protein V1477_013151 [Vespula maculifrons]|uniref:Uncharacterized protein n=1 Tax=Vespula maculifrons TaxID=7453 RepID=A0ABD2BV40_VESMC